MKISVIDLSTEEARKKQFPLMDIVKFLMSILVVALHINPFSDFGFSVTFIARLAVPFFIVTGSYFCFRKTKEEEFTHQSYLPYVGRLILLYLIWTAIYSFQMILDTVNQNEDIWRGLLMLLKNVVVSGYGHLWYLKAMAVAVLLVGFLLAKKVKIRTIFIIGGGYTFSACLVILTMAY